VIKPKGASEAVSKKLETKKKKNNTNPNQKTEQTNQKGNNL